MLQEGSQDLGADIDDFLYVLPEVLLLLLLQPQCHVLPELARLLLGELGDGVRELVVVEGRVLRAAAHDLRQPRPAAAEAPVRQSGGDGLGWARRW